MQPHAPKDLTIGAFDSVPVIQHKLRQRYNILCDHRDRMASVLENVQRRLYKLKALVAEQDVENIQRCSLVRTLKCTESDLEQTRQKHTRKNKDILEQISAERDRERELITTKNQLQQQQQLGEHIWQQIRSKRNSKAELARSLVSSSGLSAQSLVSRTTEYCTEVNREAILFLQLRMRVMELCSMLGIQQHVCTALQDPRPREHAGNDKGTQNDTHQRIELPNRTDSALAARKEQQQNNISTHTATAAPERGPEDHDTDQDQGPRNSLLNSRFRLSTRPAVLHHGKERSRYSNVLFQSDLDRLRYQKRELGDRLDKLGQEYAKAEKSRARLALSHGGEHAGGVFDRRIQAIKHEISLAQTVGYGIM